MRQKDSLEEARTYTVWGRESGLDVYGQDRLHGGGVTHWLLSEPWHEGLAWPRCGKGSMWLLGVVVQCTPAAVAQQCFIQDLGKYKTQGPAGGDGHTRGMLTSRLPRQI